MQGHYGLYDVVLNVPSVINSQGIDRVIHHRLPDHELAAIQKSTYQLRQVIEYVAKETKLMK